MRGGWTVEGGNTAALDMLQAHPEINAVVAVNDDMAIGASVAVNSLGKQLIITGLGGLTRALEAIVDKTITAVVDATPYRMGQVAMQATLDALAGKFKGGWVETATVIRELSNVLEVLRKPEALSPKPSKSY